MSNKKYLDEFGEKVIKEIYNRYMKEKNNLLSNQNKCDEDDNLCNFFKTLDTNSKIKYIECSREEIVAYIHDFMCIFEEFNPFRLMYDTGKELIDLKEVSHNEGNAGFLNGEVLDWIDDYGINLDD